MAEINQEKKDSRKILLTVFIVVLIALNGVLLYLNIQSRDENQQIVTEKESLNTELIATSQKLDSISYQLDLRITEVKRLGGDVESLQRVKEQLEADKAQLVKDRNFTVRNYNEKIKAYETLLQTKDTEIARLKVVNEELFAENTNLKTQKNMLSDSISTIERDKKKLAEKVAIASALKVENLQVNAMNDRGKERDGGEYRARQVDKIKVVFNLAENNVAEIESKDIYLRVIEPDGAALFDLSTGGGVFEYEGSETFYTAKQPILFDNTRQKLSFVYDKGTPYKSGRHVVELYADGYKIGQGSFVIK
jgi:cell division protein FtsB